MLSQAIAIERKLTNLLEGILWTRYEAGAESRVSPDTFLYLQTGAIEAIAAQQPFTPQQHVALDTYRAAAKVVFRESRPIAMGDAATYFRTRFQEGPTFADRILAQARDDLYDAFGYKPA